MPRLLTTEQLLPGLRPEDVFPFFAEPRNLQELTPPWLSFEVLAPPDLVIRQGTLIDYRLRLHGVPVRWRTLISRWDPPHGFQDTQVRGPYRQWVHTHEFETRPEGTLARDRVVYEVPGWALGDLLVRRDLRRIFTYRGRRLAARFGVAAGDVPVVFGRAATG